MANMTVALTNNYDHRVELGTIYSDAILTSYAVVGSNVGTSSVQMELPGELVIAGNEKNVQETIESVLLGGYDVIRTKLHTLNVLTQMASDSQKNQVKDNAVYLEVNMGRDSEVWRSPVSNIVVTLKEESQKPQYGVHGQQILDTVATSTDTFSKLPISVVISRKPYWETKTQYQMQLADGLNTAPQNYVNAFKVYAINDGATKQNYFYVPQSNFIGCDLPVYPTFYAMSETNESITVDLDAIHFYGLGLGSQATNGVAYSSYFELIRNTLNAFTIVDGAVNQVYNTALPNNLLKLGEGRLFKVVARQEPDTVLSMPGVFARVTLLHLGTVPTYTSPWMPIDLFNSGSSRLLGLGVFELPASVNKFAYDADSTTLKIEIKNNSGSTNWINITDMWVMPLEESKEYTFSSFTTYAGRMLFDNPLGGRPVVASGIPSNSNDGEFYPTQVSPLVEYVGSPVRFKPHQPYFVSVLPRYEPGYEDSVRNQSVAVGMYYRKRRRQL